MEQAGIQARAASDSTDETGDTPQIEGQDAFEARLIALEKGFEAVIEGQDMLLTITDEHETSIESQKAAGETGITQMKESLETLSNTVNSLVEKLGEEPKRASQSTGSPDKPKGLDAMTGDVDPLVASVFGPQSFEGGQS